jgi:predicted dehydrogenase
MRLGFAGLGWAARGFHVPALREVPQVEVVGGFDNSPEQRASWERETGKPAYASFEELLEQGKPELLSIATPPAAHYELILAALDAGLDVFCEKPFVETLEQADEVLARAEERGRRIAVNHEFREKPIFKAIHDEIVSGRVGRLVFCQIWQLMDLPPWEEHVAWRAAMPNRTLFEGGVHLVDLLLTYFDELPEAVFARHSAGFHERDADAIHLVTFEFPAGRLAQLTIDRLCPSGTRYAEVRADCEGASLRASHGGRAVVQIGKKRAESTGVRLDYTTGGLAWMEKGLRRKTLARDPRESGVYGTGKLLQKVVAAFEEGREPPSSGREARQALAVIEAAYRSAQTGERVELDWQQVPARS